LGGRARGWLELWSSTSKQKEKEKLKPGPVQATHTVVLLQWLAFIKPHPGFKCKARPVGLVNTYVILIP
jgi:hypothetical protein